MSDSSAGVLTRVQMSKVAWVDLWCCLAVWAGGFMYLWNAPRWAEAAYVGTAQYGDAEFWWNGALHVSQGIIAENPNLIYRMGYAVFAGVVSAVCGPDYLIFHKILLVLFLGVACWLYFQVKELLGRSAAVFAVLFLVFNPYTAEWMAISTSDGLGMILNLAALLSLCAGVRSGLRLGWLALFGVLLSCGSLTRPLMTLMILPAVIAVVMTAWGNWRSVAGGLTVVSGCFLIPTVAWMCFMWVATGNFALTGASQDSSALYAASDPQIQVWRPEMYVAVKESAQKRFHAEQPTANQMNQEFWALTKQNYFRYWGFHLKRAYLHALEVARFTPLQSARADVVTHSIRLTAKAGLIGALLLGAFWRWRWTGALAVLVLGILWAAWPFFQVFAVLGAGSLGILSLFWRNQTAFLWASYWWVGALALYLTGGTWGPPLGQIQDLNAFGYRLGFQSFLVGDLLVVGLLAYASRWRWSVVPRQQEETGLGDRYVWLLQPTPGVSRLVRIVTITLVSTLDLLLLGGGAVVAFRTIERARVMPVAYPDTSSLSDWWRRGGRVGAGSDLVAALTLGQAAAELSSRTGRRVLITGMSSGFIWNMPGQKRSMLLFYQQGSVKPVRMHPHRLDVEVSRHLPERAWMGRQGAWLIRSFPDLPAVSNLPYYFEVPAVQAFVPVSADGKSYDTERAVVFPLTKYGSQLSAAGDLIIRQGKTEWAHNSGTEKYPRRFALRPAMGGQPVAEVELDVLKAVGNKSVRLGIQCENTLMPSRPGPVHAAIFQGQESISGKRLWQKDLSPGPGIEWVELALGQRDPAPLRFIFQNLLPSDTLWIYELNLSADDFTK